MEIEKVKGLLADYYEGRTSREDEKLLLEYFLNEEVPEELEADRRLFLSFNDAAGEEIADQGFDEGILAVIREYEEAGRQTRMRRIYYTFSGVAAGFLILIGSYFFLIEQPSVPVTGIEPGYTSEETMLAYHEARNALLLVSSVMNTGTDQLEALSRIPDATSELNILNKFYEGTRELQTLSKFEETRERITVKQ